MAEPELGAGAGADCAAAGATSVDTKPNVKPAQNILRRQGRSARADCDTKTARYLFAGCWWLTLLKQAACRRLKLQAAKPETTCSEEWLV